LALFRFGVETISRGKGDSAVAAAAYRARDKLADERYGKSHDYTKAYGGNDLLFAGTYAPADAPDWARDREQLWNRVEAGEKRADAQLARDFIIALPHELTPEQNRWLLQDFIKEQFTRKGYVADLAIHRAHEGGDDRNVHAHLMVTMRTIGRDGFAKTKDRSQNSKEQLGAWREGWARHVNRQLERHGIEARVDHRTLAEQGIEREPEIHLGRAASAMERQGKASIRGDINREIKERNRVLAAERAQQHAAQREAAKTGRAEERRVAEAERLAELPDVKLLRAAYRASAEREDRHPEGRAGAFVQAVEAKGFLVARVTREEEAAMRHNAEVAKSHGNRKPVVEHGALLAVNASGAAYRLNGAVLDDRLAEQTVAQVDQSKLLTLGQARQAAAYFREEPKLREAWLGRRTRGRDEGGAGLVTLMSAATVTLERFAAGLEEFLFGGSRKPEPAMPRTNAPRPEARTEGEIVRAKLGTQEPTVLAQNPEIPRYRFGVDPELVEELRRRREQKEREDRRRERDR
jgi:hypothetical protein